jgi:hypothetical protein
MSRIISKLWTKLVAGLIIPIILAEYFRAETGRHYGVGFFTKLKLVYLMRRNRKKVTTASHFLEHLLMATEILKTPPQVVPM